MLVFVEQSFKNCANESMTDLLILDEAAVCFLKILIKKLKSNVLKGLKCKKYNQQKI